MCSEKKDNLWETISTPPFPIEGEAHVWRVFLDWPIEEIRKGMTNLSEEEKARARRLVNHQHRYCYIASHAALRAILTLYLPISPTPLRFRCNDYGKPYLLNYPALYFNLSNSHEVALYAITTNREVGVDVEFIRDNIYIADVRERFFSPDEVAICVSKLPEKDSQCLKKFYQIWTLKEAYVKAIGQGLSFSLNRFTTAYIGINAGTSNRMLAGQWTLRSIPSVLGYTSALATEGPTEKIRYFSWFPASAQSI
ncbi:4'-phosphopantetheinyl transferase family protein [Coxiella endosymbiont of Amblyomma sculptum]|uniref:4'-phosphopantetheinyl transferase family protein n=1 Tax=Coxiella endosymbiont of Amblyomma sculptum TaxID=2487929 RepID=UPI001356EB5D|nr:4'-phosphopantetheinyl transferase superfamily protein [Coxiella endosymbiont of Amblyomma sculptum]